MPERQHEERWPGLAIRSKNFKCFADSGLVVIKPITIFLGRNNSGKSSAFQPFLFLKQSFDSKDHGENLNSKGVLHDFGGFDDISHFGLKSEPINIKLRFHYHDKGKIKFYEAPPGTLDMSFIHDKLQNRIILSDYKVYDIYDRLYITRSLLKNGNYSLKMPNHKFKYYKNNNEMNKVLSSIKREHPFKFLFDPREINNSIIPNLKISRDKLNKAIKIYLKITGWVQYEMSELLDSISYIGPIREPPRRYYELSGSNKKYVGVRGEYAPEVLYLNRKNGIIKKLNMWLKRIGVNGKIDVIDCSPGKTDLFSIFLRQKSQNKLVNYADLGFGFSQILPILIEGLSRPSDTILILEQPEIHLNPKLQTLITDFFIELTKEKKSIIIETHSEHMLLRVRTLVAKKKISNSDVAIYFFERKDGQSYIREISMEEDGHIQPESWPKGFFEDSLEQSLNLATYQMNFKS